MLRTGNGVTTSLDLRTKSPKNKQRARFSITDINKQDFRKLFKKFENSPYLGYKSKQVHNEPIEVYFLLIKHITKLIKSDMNVWLPTNFFKLGINETNEHVNKTIGQVNKARQSEYLEIFTIRTTWADKNKPRVRKILRKNKRLQARLKMKKRHVIVIFASTNGKKQYYIKCMNARAQKNIRP